MIEAVLFDLDGTLLDTSAGVVAAVAFAVDEMGLPSLTIDEMRSFIGPPAKASFRRIYGLNESQATVATAIFRERYSKVDLLKASVYGGIFELLDWLKANKIPVSVATYKRQDYAKILLEEKGIAKYCVSIHGADDKDVKTKRDIVEDCVQALRVGDRSKSVLVGDSAHDFNGAKETGVSFLAVTYGYGYKQPGDVPDDSIVIGVADSVKQIQAILQAGFGC